MNHNLCLAMMVLCVGFAPGNGFAQSEAESTEPASANQMASDTDKKDEHNRSESTANAAEADEAPENLETEPSEIGVPTTAPQNVSADQGANEQPSNEPLNEPSNETSNEETEEANSENSQSIVIPILTTGAGVGSASAGVVVVMMGLQPLMQFYQAQAALEAEEERASGDPEGALQNAIVFQNLAYERNKEWKMVGLPMVFGGALLTFGGTVLLGAGTVGIAWALAGEDE